MKKILIVVDMQNDFIDGPLGNAECQAAVPHVVDVIRNGMYTNIILTRDTHQNNYLETQEGKHLPVVHCIENTNGWQIHPDVMQAVDEVMGRMSVEPMIFDKPAFGSMELAAWIREHVTQMDEIDLVGVCTGICVISNAMLAKAAAPETKICVIGKACACVTPASHQTALDAMKLCQIEIV